MVQVYVRQLFFPVGIVLELDNRPSSCQGVCECDDWIKATYAITL